MFKLLILAQEVKILQFLTNMRAGNYLLVWQFIFFRSHLKISEKCKKPSLVIGYPLLPILHKIYRDIKRLIDLVFIQTIEIHILVNAAPNKISVHNKPVCILLRFRTVNLVNLDRKSVV